MASDRRDRPQTTPAQEDLADFMYTLGEMAYAIQEQAATTHQMMDQLGRRPKAGYGRNPNGLEANLEYLKFAKFKKANPPNFRGAFDPDKTEEQVKVRKKVFSVLDYTDHQKVAFATYMLEADAEFQWDGVKRLLEGFQMEITWDVFKETFYQKYFPVLVRNAKELEFMQLRQENSSILEYIAKFEELCKFSTIYQQKRDEAWKCVKFEGGQTEDILAVVEPMEIRDFPTLVNKCHLIEDCNKNLAVAKSIGSNFKKGLAKQGSKLKPNFQQQKKFPTVANQGKQP